MPSPRRLSPVDIATIAVLVALVAIFAVLRWPGFEPFGSDHDEYRMVAESLLAGEGPVVAGIEGTKYPLGYPVLLAAAAAVGLPMTTFALALNVALVAVTVLLVWAAARTYGAVAGVGAGGFVAVGAGLWDAVYAVMPDVALTAVVAAVVLAVVRIERRAVVGRPDRIRWRTSHVVWLGVLAAVAVSLKAVAVLLGVALGAHLLLRSGARRLAWVPPAAAVGMLGLQSLAVGSYPQHTTGYAATFWLRDPYDAAAGEVGVSDLPGRVLGRIDVFAADVGRAVIGPHAPDALAIAVVVVLLGVALVAWNRERPYLAVFVAIYTLGLAAWPFRSIRFGMPLHPVAALGVAALVGGLVIIARGRRGSPGRVLVAAVTAAAVAVFGVWSAQRVVVDAVEERLELATVHRSVDEARRWMEANIPDDEPIASLDYREFAWRLDRPVLPVGYTSDPQQLWDQVGGAGAEWFVAIRGLYNARDARQRELLDAYGDRLEEVFANERVRIWRVR